MHSEITVILCQRYMDRVWYTGNRYLCLGWSMSLTRRKSTELSGRGGWKENCRHAHRAKPTARNLPRLGLGNCSCIAKGPSRLLLS